MKVHWVFVGTMLTFVAVIVSLYLVFVEGEGKSSLWWSLAVGALLLHIGANVVLYRHVVNPLRILNSGMGLLRSQDFSSRLARVGQREVDNVVGVFNEMITHLRAERLLVQETNTFVSLLIEASPMAVILLDVDGRIQSINPATFRLLSLDPALQLKGLPLREAVHHFPIDLTTLPLGTCHTVRLSGASIVRCSHLSFPRLGMRQSFYLIESLTDEIRAAERTAYEKVIRMIAHEVNNSMTGLLTTLQIVGEVLLEHAEELEVQTAVEGAMARMQQLSQFIGEIASVVRIPTPHIDSVEVGALIERSVRFMESSCVARDIRISCNIEAEQCIDCDAVLMEQVLINIIKNAAESIDREGEIVVTLRTNPLSIVVEDTGRGINEVVAQQLFTPFFSTKENGQGIGLLLIREVLDRHQMGYSLRTDPDGRTRFTILL